MNIFKKIGQLLFGKKDAVHPECGKIYSELEKIKNISTEEFNSLTREQQQFVVKEELKNPYIIKVDPSTSPETPSLMGTSKTIVPEYNKEENDKFYGHPLDERVTSGYLRTEDDVTPKMGITTVSDTDDIMVVDVNQNPPKISFFTPEDNKEITLDEKKSDEIKKKRQYKKKKKK